MTLGFRNRKGDEASGRQWFPWVPATPFPSLPSTMV